MVSNGSQSVPIAGRTRRASSILDVGGRSSLNNFASSVQRSVNFLSSSVDSKTGFTGFVAPLLAGQEGEEVVYGALGSPSTLPADSSALLTPTISEEEGAEIDILLDENDNIIKVTTHKSTSLQTIFNSINVLIGLGVFSIPLAFHMSGWILGLASLTFAAYSTNLAAILIGRIMERYPHLRNYQDIGVFVFGSQIGVFILVTFALDLLGAGLSMIIMFADSFNTLFPSIAALHLKVFVVCVLFVLNFMPLRLLSFLSLIGILCTSTTCLVIFLAGFFKPNSPGSLIEIMPTNLWPTSTVDFFFALGLHLAPWGGLSTFPEIHLDMQHPTKYDHCMNVSFGFSYLVDLSTGILGFLMFGSIIEDEVTKSILSTPGYPKIIGSIVVTLMGFLPISKLPLVSRPIITSLDSILGGTVNKWVYLANRVLVSVVYLFLSLVLTNFGVVMSLLGSAICFAICITLPLIYYLKLFDVKGWELIKLQTIVALSILGAVFGTLAVFWKMQQ